VQHHCKSPFSVSNTRVSGGTDKPTKVPVDTEAELSDDDDGFNSVTTLNVCVTPDTDVFLELSGGK
jgi:hypothetical protein